MSPSPCPTESSPPRWALARRAAFRFFFCYFILYGMPESGRVSLPDAIPGAHFLRQYWEKLWHAIVPWVAVHVFGIAGQPATYFRTGSGDTTLQYITNLLYLVIALAAAAAWTVLDRRRPNYLTLERWLRLWVRYTLAFTLFAYGFAKVFPLQFQPPFPGKLVEQWGDFSPMGALWSFMGASVAYTMISGAAELTGGLLLLFRRTATIGAMVSFAVLFNVAALNYCYDVPVKLYSTNLVLMAAWLAAPDLSRLLRLLAEHRDQPVFERRRRRIAATVFWAIFVGYILYGHISGGWQTYQAFYIHPQRPSLYGVWDVDSGPEGWRRMVVSSDRGLDIKTDRGTLTFRTRYAANKLTLDDRDDLYIIHDGQDRIELDGTLFGSPAKLKLHPAKFLLLTRGFHWINEMPFNR